MPLPENLPERFNRAIIAFLVATEEKLESGFRVYLFGSLSRGDYLMESDIDVVVVSEELKA